MATLIYGDKQTSVADGELIRDAAESLGILFGCKKGDCGTCLSVVEDGMENLSNLSQKEEDFGLEENERLICQCKILKGAVTLG